VEGIMKTMLHYNGWGRDNKQSKPIHFTASMLQGVVYLVKVI